MCEIKLQINVKELNNAMEKLKDHSNCESVEFISKIEDETRNIILVVPIDNKTEIRYNITELIDLKTQGLNTLYPDLSN